MPRIDFIAIATPNFTRPELLCHHTIPQPLFGTTPRFIRGQEWWDKTRRAAYVKNNMRCWACGGEGPLEAHEAYIIDYHNARMTYVETVALCNRCHSFIHIGRTVGMFARREVESQEVKRIVLHGYRTLKKAGLKCPWETRVILSPRLPWKGSRQWIDRVIAWSEEIPPLPRVPEWSSWRLVLDGEEYKPRYESFDRFKEEAL